MMTRSILTVPPAVLMVAMVACGRNTVAPSSQSLTPVAPSGMADASTPGREAVLVTMQDACDPETFNAVLGPGTCVRSGGVTFDRFLDELRRFGSIGPWRNAPSTAHVEAGQTFVAVNRGGETHTFTRVAEFGGGVVPLLNDLAHVPNVAPECTSLESDDFVPPGGTYREAVERTGTLKFQCCIHPWMKLEASSH